MQIQREFFFGKGWSECLYKRLGFISTISYSFESNLLSINDFAYYCWFAFFILSYIICNFISQDIFLNHCFLSKSMPLTIHDYIKHVMLLCTLFVVYLNDNWMKSMAEFNFSYFNKMKIKTIENCMSQSKTWISMLTVEVMNVCNKS